jgi:2-polyprenyl-3-methyl-5-hydroxy-6-metoxy-1,4-benzoquinol methylase
MDKVSEYYNNYSERQLKFVNNKRHITLCNLVKKTSTLPCNNILEIGCGVGAITMLLNKTIKPKQIYSTDISSHSIEIAKKKSTYNNIHFFQANFYQDKLLPIVNKKFDIITLFDVLEHIPLEQHTTLFMRMVEFMDINSLLFINIPAKEHLEYIIKNRPEELQIIDLPLETHYVIQLANQAGLDIVLLKKQSIWQEYDYTSFVFKLKSEFSNIDVKQTAPSLISKIINKLFQ